MNQSTRLFVSNLPENFNEHALRETFSSYGEVINFDLKSKPGAEDTKKFAFVTLSANNFNIESCIRHFSNEDFDGYKLYVTRARESFLERLQREREQSLKIAKKDHKDTVTQQNQDSSYAYSLEKRKLNADREDDPDKDFYNKKPKIHKFVTQIDSSNDYKKSNKKFNNNIYEEEKKIKVKEIKKDNSFLDDKKKQDSDKKRLESLKKKRQEFKEKKNIIKTGLISIDKQQNKKIIFSDNDEESVQLDKSKTNGYNVQTNHKNHLFDDEGSDDEINFEIKEQYEGRKGQKVLDLQSRYKSDKRFILDERFVEDSASEKEDSQEDNQEGVDLNHADEMSKQRDILQEVLNVAITKTSDTGNKTKSKLGMLRFDLMQPDHVKYLAPMSETQEPTKKTKKKKSKDNKQESPQKKPEVVVEKVEVSKEQFYKVSDTLKEAMNQPNTFSLRSLFSKDNKIEKEDEIEESVNYIPIQTKNSAKMKNPLDLGEKNPFVYDSSESENEDDIKNEQKDVSEKSEIKTVWRENLFFSPTDNRLKDGLLFFSRNSENETRKDRRELKSLMKKRIYNRERKNTMFQKKIGGRKKTMKKKLRK